MKPWELDQIRRSTKSKWLARGGTTAFTGKISTDSRKAAAGDLFFAISGKKFNAHDFLTPVIEGNVAAIIVHEEPSAELLALAQAKGVAVLLTDDTVAALNRLAAAYRNEIRAKVIAVGGSNGKTTTKRIIHALLNEKYGSAAGHASPKSFNNNIGMPLTLLEVEPKHEFVVLEIGTNAPGEIAALGEVARPDIALITNIGLEHLERLGDLEGVAREEASIGPFIQKGGTLVLPADVPELGKHLKTTKSQRITVGRGSVGVKAAAGEPDNAVDLQLTDVVESVHGCSFTVNARGGFRIPLLGQHNALNALFAIAVARRLGASDAQIQAGLNKVTPAPMRLELLEIPVAATGTQQISGTYFVINDAYNANPSSVAAALETFDRLKVNGASGAEEALRPRRIAILGDMLELGAVSQAMHRTIGAAVGASKVDIFIAVGSEMAAAADAATRAGLEVIRFKSTAEACQAIGRIVRPGDALLVKGSRGMAMDAVIDALRPKAAESPTRTRHSQPA